MGKAMFVLVSIVLMNLPKSVCAQIPPEGFFLGGSATALMMNGKGETEGDDLKVTDDLFKMTVDEDIWGLDLELEYKGWSWENKLLFGFKPLIGYRISPQFAISGSYSYYIKKNGEQSDSYNSSFISGLRFNMNADMEYSQSVVQILGQFNPAKGKGFFLAAGIEFVFMKSEMSNEFIVTEPGYGTERMTWKAKGNDKATGFILGGGVEVPLHSKNMSFIATALYSLTKYDGDELLKVKSASGTVSDPDIDIELGVGGFMGSIGLRMYFNSSKATQ